jgi:hypothetical protein
MSSKGNKVKILIFVVFIIVTVVFVTEIFGFLKIGFGTINEKKQELNCKNYKILESTYLENNLFIEVAAYGSNLTKITVVDNNLVEHVKDLQPIITSGTTGNIAFKNIRLEKGYTVYFENCKEYGKEYEI